MKRLYFIDGISQSKETFIKEFLYALYKHSEKCQPGRVINSKMPNGYLVSSDKKEPMIKIDFQQIIINALVNESKDIAFVIDKKEFQSYKGEDEQRNPEKTQRFPYLILPESTSVFFIDYVLKKDDIFEILEVNKNTYTINVMEEKIRIMKFECEIISVKDAPSYSYKQMVKIKKDIKSVTVLKETKKDVELEIVNETDTTYICKHPDIDVFNVLINKGSRNYEVLLK